MRLDRHGMFFQGAGLLSLAAFLFYLFVGPMHVFGTISLFSQSLDSPPLFWWPLVCWPVALAFGVWGVGGIFMLRYLSGKRGLWVLICTGIFLCLAFAADMAGGVALYSDRIIRRDLSRLNPHMETLWLSEATRVELTCDQVSRRVRRGADRRLGSTAVYRVIFANGRSVNLAEGYYKPKFQATWLKTVSDIDRQLSVRGVPRRLADGQSLAVYSQCVQLFTQDFPAARRNTYLYLFSPDSSAKP